MRKEVGHGSLWVGGKKVDVEMTGDRLMDLGSLIASGSNLDK